MSPRAKPIALIAHGGAGAYDPSLAVPSRRQGLIDAVRQGAEILDRGGTALDAVIAAVVALEDHPLFNAGRGSLLNTEGKVEMDASVMVAEQNGATRAGAVGAVSRVRNPIELARAVMERTPHLLVVGLGAEKFARRAGVAMCGSEELITERARERWQERRTADSIVRAQRHGTVGAVALDASGTLAAATSTGGFPGKIPGRIGDSALIGAGTFASRWGAASATGQGEAIIMTALCRALVEEIAEGHTPAVAARRAIADLIGPLRVQAGVIAIDSRGRIGIAHNAAMSVAAFTGAGGIRHSSPASIPVARRK